MTILNKKISLIFPPPSEPYRDFVCSIKEAPSPPQTALAELGAYIKKSANSPVAVTSINPQVVNEGTVRFRTVEEIVEFCSDSMLVGLTCLYHNQETAHQVAETIKKQDPSKRVVLGGQNVSNSFMARLVLNQVQEVDFVIIGDGEEALLGLVEGKPLNQIPNLAYRESGKVVFTRRKSIDIKNIPLWDYEDTLDARILLEAHDSRTETYGRLVQKYRGRTPGEIGVFSQRGCPKAAGKIGNSKGQCIFCTSVGSQLSKRYPDNFWN